MTKNNKDIITLTDDGKIFCDLKMLEKLERSGALGKSVHIMQVLDRMNDEIAELLPKKERAAAIVAMRESLRWQMRHNPMPLGDFVFDPAAIDLVLGD